MLLSIIIMTGVMTAITAPGLIAQHLEERRKAGASSQTVEGHANV